MIPQTRILILIHNNSALGTQTLLEAVVHYDQFRTKSENP